MGPLNPPLFDAQRSYWHTASCSPPPLGLSLLACTPPHVHPPSELSLFTCTPPCATPLRGSASLHARCPVSASNIICDPSLSLTDIVLFGFSLLDFRDSLQSFKMRLLVRNFHTLIKNDSFSSPINMGSHIIKF